MHAWLRGFAGRLARASGVDADALELSPAEIDALLAAAGVAAHESGARTNAPLACYLLGVARGRTGKPLAELVDGVASDPTHTGE